MDTLELLQANAGLLDSACDLLERTPHRVYTEPIPGVGGTRVGPQIRHVIEFYSCLLDGLDAGVIDYDTRKRDPNIERNAVAAITSLRHLSDRLCTDHRLRADMPLVVRMEDAPSGDRQHLLPSSLRRELQALRSHTIHHFALISITLQLWGVTVDRTFGVAPATLRYRAANLEDAA
jgi:hypothetical protein